MDLLRLQKRGQPSDRIGHQKDIRRSGPPDDPGDCYRMGLGKLYGVAMILFWRPAVWRAWYWEWKIRRDRKRNIRRQAELERDYEAN